MRIMLGRRDSIVESRICEFKTENGYTYFNRILHIKRTQRSNANEVGISEKKVERENNDGTSRAKNNSTILQRLDPKQRLLHTKKE